MSAATLRRRAWLGYLLGGAVLIALYMTAPPLKGSGPVFNLLGLSPALAIAAGVRLNRPRASAPWWWFAAGFLLFWLGDLYTYSYPKLLHREVPFP
jgi:sterol desaturase/sphingolipid hydroxylase (fatty acid hydroxylase superfamily)